MCGKITDMKVPFQLLSVVGNPKIRTWFWIRKYLDRDLFIYWLNNVLGHSMLFKCLEKHAGNLKELPWLHCSHHAKFLVMCYLEQHYSCFVSCIVLRRISFSAMPVRTIYSLKNYKFIIGEIKSVALNSPGTNFAFAYF